jgi:phage virion morphogenesis protein
MAGIDIRFELEENLLAGLGRAIAAGADLTPAMQEIANHLAASTRKRFEDEAGPSGAKWIQSRRAREEGGQTLSDRGDLKGSIRAEWGSNFAGAGPERSGGAAVYAAIHQFGDIRTIAVKPHKRTVDQLFGKQLVEAITLSIRRIRASRTCLPGPISALTMSTVARS